MWPQDALLSTPAASAVIRTREGGFVPFGAFILSASHNPGAVGVIAFHTCSIMF